MPHTDLADPEAAPTGTARRLLCREVPGESREHGTGTRTLEIDPVKRRIYLLMVQRADFPNPDASEVRRAFQEAAASALNGE